MPIRNKDTYFLFYLTSTFQLWPNWLNPLCALRLSNNLISRRLLRLATGSIPLYVRTNVRSCVRTYIRMYFLGCTSTRTIHNIQHKIDLSCQFNVTFISTQNRFIAHKLNTTFVKLISVSSEATDSTGCIWYNLHNSVFPIAGRQSQTALLRIRATGFWWGWSDRYLSTRPSVSRGFR